MLFSKKRNEEAHPSLYMNQILIETVSTHKHLGLTLSSDAKWTSHISIIIDKAWQRIGVMRALKFLLNRKSLEHMYFSFVRPLLEYADVVWDNISDSLKHDLESVQNEVARIVSGATKYCNIQKLLFELKWETLTERRKKHRLLMLYKMLYGISPPYLTSLSQSSQNDDERYNLRRLRSVRANTQFYNSTFLPRTVRDWNLLPESTRNSSTIEQFKMLLNNNRVRSCPLFDFGLRKSQILHTRLRFGCSSLNYDLHRRNLVDNSLCQCGQVETVDHFLIHCRRYQQIRINIFPTSLVH